MGATNKNENSNGSVIPVKKEVKAADNIKPQQLSYVLGEHFYKWRMLPLVNQTS